MSFDRLSWGHWVAALAALALLLVMAMDWYGTVQSDSLRRDERLAYTGGAESGEAGRLLKREIPAVAEQGEKNAWQAYGGADVIVLLLLLAAIASALAAAALFAAARLYEPAVSTVPTAVGLLALLTVAYKIIDQPGLDSVTTLRSGAPIGLGLLALIVFGGSQAMRAESRAEVPADAPSRRRAPRRGAAT